MATIPTQTTGVAARWRMSGSSSARLPSEPAACSFQIGGEAQNRRGSAAGDRPVSGHHKLACPLLANRPVVEVNALRGGSSRSDLPDVRRVRRVGGAHEPAVESRARVSVRRAPRRTAVRYPPCEFELFGAAEGLSNMTGVMAADLAPCDGTPPGTSSGTMNLLYSCRDPSMLIAPNPGHTPPMARLDAWTC